MLYYYGSLGSFVSSSPVGVTKSWRRFSALARRGTGALHQSLRGSWHRSNGTGPSSGIAARGYAPSVIAAATLASSTLSVYDRVAPTTLVRHKGDQSATGHGRCLRLNRHTRGMPLSVPIEFEASVMTCGRTANPYC